MERHERDSAEIRKIILAALNDVKKIVTIDLEIEIEPNTEYGENIILKIPPESSGISKLGGKEGETYNREGAKIVFNQIYSNGSEVSFRMSHVEGLTEAPKTELKDKTPRQQISREYIIEKVLAFLEEVVDYER